MNSPAVTLRPVIRATMRAAPKQPWTPESLLSTLSGPYPTATLADIKAALMWNHSKGFVDFTHNAELEADAWKITPRGLKA